LLNEYRENTSVILIIDEAQNLPFETMEEIRMISNLNDEKVPLLHIILSGQPNLINRLNNPKLEQLRQRVSVHYHLDPLDKEESFLYTEHRLKTAGATDLDIFTPDALESIYMYSEGIPRVINLICDMALVYGYAEQIKPVDRSIIDMVAEDRRKMGLGFGSNSNFSGSVKPGRFNNSLDRTVSLEKKFQELNDNVSELALLVRKMIRNKDFVEKMDQKHQQEIEQLYQKVKGLEEKLSVSAYQKMIQNLMSKWTHAEADKENR
jgi:general secretion pathway protein A